MHLNDNGQLGSSIFKKRGNGFRVFLFLPF